MFLFIKGNIDVSGWYKSYSNTSYVLIYRRRLFIITIIFLIQIHPMFLFIFLDMKSSTVRGNSNTSYVLIYRRWEEVLEVFNLNSNTSYVLIYQNRIKR